MTIRVAVTGGRNFNDVAFVYSVLDSIHASNSIIQLIHGAAKGADTICGEWAEENYVPVIKCPARWDRHGKSAGPIRNRKMLALQPDALIAFPGGEGTADMISAAQERKIYIYYASK